MLDPFDGFGGLLLALAREARERAWWAAYRERLKPVAPCLRRVEHDTIARYLVEAGRPLLSMGASCGRTIAQCSHSSSVTDPAAHRHVLPRRLPL